MEHHSEETDRFVTRDGREVRLDLKQQILFYTFRENLPDAEALAMAVAEPADAQRDEDMLQFTSDLVLDLRMRAGVKSAVDSTSGRKYKRLATGEWSTEVKGEITIKARNGQTYRLHVERVD